MVEKLGTPKAKILVVDDESANRALAQAILEDEGYSVILAAGGEQAVALFASEAPDCVLLDIRMPGEDGFATCARLREKPGGPETPIIFLTAMRDVDAFDHASLVGADDFLTKPVRATDLLARVKTVLHLRRLDSERRALFAELRQQRDMLMRLQLHKEQLTAFLLHDLKNPIGAMTLNAELILREPTITPRTRRAAMQVQSSARHLLRMLLNLLDIARSDVEQLKPRRVSTDLAALARAVLAELKDQADASEVTLRAEEGVWEIAVDRDMVHRVLANLVENAIRHAPEGSEVSVHLTGDAKRLEVRVADRGTGVPAARREAIFERFVQLDVAADSRTGRGLGLAFCKLAVEAHGGRIWVEDGAPGAVFCVDLPRVLPVESPGALAVSA